MTMVDTARARGYLPGVGTEAGQALGGFHFPRSQLRMSLPNFKIQRTLPQGGLLVCIPSQGELSPSPLPRETGTNHLPKSLQADLRVKLNGNLPFTMPFVPFLLFLFFSVPGLFQ